jgi:flagellar hook-length control protein FliK
VEAQHQITALLTGALPSQRVSDFGRSPSAERAGFDGMLQKEMQPGRPESIPAQKPARREEPLQPRPSSENSATRPESHQPQRNEFNENPTPRETPPVETPVREKPATPANKTVTETKITASKNSQPATTSPTAEQQLVDRLKELGVETEKINALLEFLRNQAKGPGDHLLKVLSGLLETAAQAFHDRTGLDTLATAQQATGDAQAKDILNTLLQAGLTEADARKVLDSLRATLTAKSETNSLLQLDRTATQAALKNIEGASSNNPSNQQNFQNTGQRPTGNPLLNAEGSSVTGLGDDKLESLVTLLTPDKNGAATQATPQQILSGKAALSSLSALNLTGTASTASQGHAEGALVPGGSAVGDSSAKAMDALRPSVPETYSPRATVDKSVATQIVEKFSLKGMGNQREFNIRLEPPSLGTVRMNVTSSGEMVRTTIVAENQMVKQVIEGNLNQLKESITSQGLKVDSFTVLVGGDQAGNTAHQREESIRAFRPFDDSFGLGEEIPADAPVGYNRYFFSESQSISLFA